MRFLPQRRDKHDSTRPWWRPRPCCLARGIPVVEIEWGERMETKYYVVSRIDGDYAWLRRTDAEEEPLFIARALLPDTVFEGARLLFENFEYTQL